jgi:tetratricopeptide (TPR) repeat protein
MVYIDEGLRIFEKVDNKFMLSMIRLEMARISMATGDLEMAEAHIKNAYTLLEGIDFPYGLGSIHQEHGVFLKQRGDVPGAIEEYQKAHDIFKKIGAVKDAETARKAMEGLKAGGHGHGPEDEKRTKKSKEKDGKGKGNGQKAA